MAVPPQVASRSCRIAGRITSRSALPRLERPWASSTEVGAFYWTALVLEIVNSGRKEQGPVSV